MNNNFQKERFPFLSQLSAFDIHIDRGWFSYGLNPYEWAVFCNLMSHQQDHSEVTISIIVSETQISRSSVFKAIKGLKEKGLIKQ